MKNSILLIILLLSLLFSCNKKDENIKSINLDNILSEKAVKILAGSTLTVSFPFCDMVPLKQWDQMILISPYMNFRKLKENDLKNIENVIKILEENALSEDRCALLFLWKKTIIAYAIPKRLPIDFLGLVVNNNKNIDSFLKEDCGDFYLKKEIYKNEKRLLVRIKTNEVFNPL